MEVLHLRYLIYYLIRYGIEEMKFLISIIIRRLTLVFAVLDVELGLIFRVGQKSVVVRIRFRRPRLRTVE